MQEQVIGVWNNYKKKNRRIFKMVYQCGSCEQVFEKLDNEECPYCHSGNWVKGYIDE